MAAVVIAIRARNRRRRQKQQQHDELVVFEKYDTEHTGKLNPAQLRRALIDLGIEASSVEAEAVLDKYARRGHSEGDEFVDRMHIPGGGLDVRSFRALVSDITERSSHLSEERTIEKLARQASLDKLAIRGRLPYEHQVRAFYMGKSCTIFFAALIAANFLINCIEKEVDPGTGASRQQQSPGLWVVSRPVHTLVLLPLMPRRHRAVVSSLQRVVCGLYCRLHKFHAPPLIPALST